MQTSNVVFFPNFPFLYLTALQHFLSINQTHLEENKQGKFGLKNEKTTSICGIEGQTGCQTDRQIDRLIQHVLLSVPWGLRVQMAHQKISSPSPSRASRAASGPCFSVLHPTLWCVIFNPQNHYFVLHSEHSLKRDAAQL